MATPRRNEEEILGENKRRKNGKKGIGGGGTWPLIESKKDLQVNRLKGTHLFTIPNFFTAAEAKAFIEVAESLDFTHQGSRGPAYGEAYRDNDRISVTDPVLAERMWNAGMKKIFDDIKIQGKLPIGLNPNIRFYRIDLSYVKLEVAVKEMQARGSITELKLAIIYKVGQWFGRHIDESVDLGGGHRTLYTLLIYLTGTSSSKPRREKEGNRDSMQSLGGGETVFYDQRQGVVAEVAPVAGMALLHVHGAKCMLHEARAVTKNVKYVLRSDVVFA